MTTQIEKQLFFNRVWQHFVVEGNLRSVDDRDACRYRGNNNTACAVGIFLTDEEAQNWDKLHLSSLPTALMKTPDHWMQNHLQFLCELQHAHDNYADGDRIYTKALLLIAHNHHLQIPE